MSRIHCNHVLPKELAIESIEDILYSIGLCQDSVKDPPKRPAINNPKFITTFLVITLMMKVVSHFTDDELTLILLTQFGHYLGIKTYINLCFTFLTLIVLFSEANYYRNYKRGVKPSFIRVFQAMSGSVPPSSVGLKDERLVKQLLRTAKWLPLIKKNNQTINQLMNSLFLMSFYYFGLDLESALTIGIYPTIINTLWGYYTFNIIIIQLFLFYILCKYFALKIEALNQFTRTSRFIGTRRITRILHSYDALFREMNEYNTTYWSQFLFTIWLFFGVVLVVFIYFILFAPIPSTLKAIFSYFIVILIILYLFIMTTASSVNSEAYKSYNILNSMATKYYMPRKPGCRINFKTAIKVKIYSSTSHMRPLALSESCHVIWSYMTP